MKKLYILAIIAYLLSILLWIIYICKKEIDNNIKLIDISDLLHKAEIRCEN